MNNNELNQYIKHYLEEDKTHSAIMLTGDWGTGKSYYIQNTLVPFLSTRDNGNHKCVIVSLYGLSSISEISGKIYWSLRTEKLSHWIKKNISSHIPGKANTASREIASVVGGVGKSILTSSLSKGGINLSISDKDLKRIFESIDLSGCLIILEDLERSSLDVVEVLGFVNTLVEQDNVKVLLVVNEKELIQYEPNAEKGEEVDEQVGKLFEKYSEKENRNYTASTKLYLRRKEKTVSDTIKFEGDFSIAIKEIIVEFNNPYLDKLTGEDRIIEVISFCERNSITNLRTFISACQKFCNIFNGFNSEMFYEKDFSDTVFFGVLFFLNGLKKGKRPQWKGGDTFSVELATEEFPLFRFCYDYIIHQSVDNKKAEDGKKALEKYRLYDKKKSLADPDLLILYNWWIHSEKEVHRAVNSISSRLLDESSISFFEYGRLAKAIVAAKNVLEISIDEIKNLLIKNLYNKGSEITKDYLFTTPMSNQETPETIKEYEELVAKMKEALVARERTIFDFEYEPSSVSAFYNRIDKNNGRILEDGAFASRLDVDSIVSMLKRCTPEQMNDFRGTFLSVYRSDNIGEFLSGDKQTIENLLSKVIELESFESFDKIQQKQMHWFADNLRGILAKLQT